MATLLSAVKAVTKALFGPGGSADSAQGLLNLISQSGSSPRRGTKELLDAYRTSPWFHAAIHKIAVTTAEQSFNLYKTKRQNQSADVKQSRSAIGYAPKDGVEVKEHPLIALLDNPSPVFTRAVFFQLVQAYLDAKGECFIVVERKGKLPTELWVVPPHWVQATPFSGFPYYRFAQGGWLRTISEDDVFVMTDPDLVNPYERGVGFGESMADELDIDEFATKHLKSWFFNRAMPDVIVSMEGIKTDDQARAFQEKMRSKYGGAGNGFQAHVTGSKIQVTELGMSFKDQQLTELRQQERDVVLQVLGIPPEIMGIVTNSNRATIDAATVIFMRGVISPRLKFLADAITKWARVNYADDTLQIGFVSPIPEDNEFQLTVMNAQPELFTKNEFRHLAGMKPIDGWDDEFVESKAPMMFGAGDPNALPAGEEEDDAVDGTFSEEPVTPDDAEDDIDDEEAKAAGRLLRVVGAERPRGSNPARSKRAVGRKA